MYIVEEIVGIPINKFRLYNKNKYVERYIIYKSNSGLVNSVDSKFQIRDVDTGKYSIVDCDFLWNLYVKNKLIGSVDRRYLDKKFWKFCGDFVDIMIIEYEDYVLASTLDYRGYEECEDYYDEDVETFKSKYYHVKNEYFMPFCEFSYDGAFIGVFRGDFDYFIVRYLVMLWHFSSSLNCLWTSIDGNMLYLNHLEEYAISNNCYSFHIDKKYRFEITNMQEFMKCLARCKLRRK